MLSTAFDSWLASKDQNLRSTASHQQHHDVNINQTDENKMRKHSGKGTINFNNGDIYAGDFKDAAPHGVGKMT